MKNRKAAVGFIFVTLLLDVIGLGIIIPVIPSLIQELTGEGLSEASRYGGWLIASYAIIQFLCAPIVGSLSDKYGRRPILLLSLLGFGMDYLVLAFAPSIGWLFLARIIAGFFGASFTTDMGGMAMTIGGDVHSDNTSSADETAMGVKATIGSLVVVANSVQKEAAAGVDVTTYSAAYTTGGLVIGFQGADNDASSYSATYTIVPGMQFEIGSLDNGTTSTSSAELQMTF